MKNRVIQGAKALIPKILKHLKIHVAMMRKPAVPNREKSLMPIWTRVMIPIPTGTISDSMTVRLIAPNGTKNLLIQMKEMHTEKKRLIQKAMKILIPNGGMTGIFRSTETYRMKLFCYV
jgi:hypothetical protein